MEFLIEAKPMTKWDKRFCELAEFVSKWSKDPNAQDNGFKVGYFG